MDPLLKALNSKLLEGKLIPVVIVGIPLPGYIASEPEKAQMQEYRNRALARFKYFAGEEGQGNFFRSPKPKALARFLTHMEVDWQEDGPTSVTTLFTTAGQLALRHKNTLQLKKALNEEIERSATLKM